MFARLITRIDDALNPIVVKELRQAVQSRFVVVVLLLFLGLQLLILGSMLVVSDANKRADLVDYSAGAGIFLGLQYLLVVTCLVFIPLYTGVRMAAERADNNVDLLFVSTLRPRNFQRPSEPSSSALMPRKVASASSQISGRLRRPIACGSGRSTRRRP